MYLNYKIKPSSFLLRKHVGGCLEAEQEVNTRQNYKMAEYALRLKELAISLIMVMFHGYKQISNVLHCMFFKKIFVVYFMSLIF